MLSCKLIRVHWLSGTKVRIADNGSGCLTIRALVEYDPTDLKPVSYLMSQVLPQCPPDLPLLEGTYISSRQFIRLASKHGLVSRIED